MGCVVSTASYFTPFDLYSMIFLVSFSFGYTNFFSAIITNYSVTVNQVITTPAFLLFHIKIYSEDNVGGSIPNILPMREYTRTTRRGYTRTTCL